MEQPPVELSRIGGTSTTGHSNHNVAANNTRHEETSTNGFASTTALDRNTAGGRKITSRVRKYLRVSFAHDLEVHNPRGGIPAADSGLVRDFYGE